MSLITIELAVATGAGSNTEETSDHEYVDMDSQQQNSETSMSFNWCSIISIKNNMLCFFRFFQSL